MTAFVTWFERGYDIAVSVAEELGIRHREVLINGVAVTVASDCYSGDPMAMCRDQAYALFLKELNNK